MNKRILELADEAEELDYETFDNYNHKTVKHYKFNKEKFAELIVRECAHRSEELGQPEIGKGLMKHFGVDE